MTDIIDQATYLYNTENGEVEVKLTGRFADRTSDITNAVSRYIEIEPVDETLNWAKFVRINQISKIRRMEA